MHARMCVQSCLTLRSYGLWSTRILCPWDFPGKNIGLGFISFSRRYSWPRDQICISSRSCTGRQILYHCATWEAPKCNESCATLLLQHYLNQETVVHIYSGILLSHRKEWTWVHWPEVDKPRTYYTEWSKSEREKNILCSNEYTWNLEKWYRWTYLQGRNRDADIENGLWTVGEGDRGWIESRL